MTATYLIARPTKQVCCLAGAVVSWRIMEIVQRSKNAADMRGKLYRQAAVDIKKTCGNLVSYDRKPRSSAIRSTLATWQDGICHISAERGCYAASVAYSDKQRSIACQKSMNRVLHVALSEQTLDFIQHTILPINRFQEYAHVKP